MMVAAPEQSKWGRHHPTRCRLNVRLKRQASDFLFATAFVSHNMDGRIGMCSQLNLFICLSMVDLGQAVVGSQSSFVVQH